MYTFKNTEQNNKKASDLETKSMLYLLGMHKEKQHIETIAIDCFNDVTGINKSKDKLWDIQSKNHTVMNPAKIGKSLFTLFDNFESKIDFFEYILFIPKLNDSYLNNNKLNDYGISNIELKTLRRIEDGLIKEYSRVHKKTPSSANLKSFLAVVIFVQDYKRTTSYIKEITKFKSNTLKNEKFYQSIFDEVRNVQASKKNSCIEGKSIKIISEIISFNRHLYKKDIYTLIINRFVGGDLFATNIIPLPFIEVLKPIDDIQDQKDLLTNCTINITRSFFNKNDKRFWSITESIILELNKNPNKGIFDVYNSINGDKIRLPFLDKESILLLISIIKNGWNNED